ncbi:MAG TPA: hypothetical protein VD866_18985, partial [Urbifossiella sp.]|nr:hypothetical protein [Urbifossiella sp.]
MSPPARLPRRLLAVGAVLAVVGAAAAAGWWYTHRPAPAVRPLVLVVSGDTAGWIVPCGCTSNQSGGMPRRGTYVAGLRADADVIVADAGGAPGGTSPYQRVKFEAILSGERAMGLDAHNVGGPETALGADYLRRFIADTGAPLVSANLRAADGSLVAEPLRIVERGGRRVALVGVLSRHFAVPGGRLDDPREAILREAAAAKGRYDSLVVLAYAPEDELRQLAAGLPEADAVVGGPTGQSIAPLRLGPTVLASATNKGEFVVRLDAVGRGWDGRVVEMDAAYADDPGQRANVADYLAVLGRATSQRP